MCKATIASNNTGFHGTTHVLIGGRQYAYLGDVLRGGRLLDRAAQNAAAVGAFTLVVRLEQTLSEHTR